MNNLEKAKELKKEIKKLRAKIIEQNINHIAKLGELQNIVNKMSQIFHSTIKLKRSLIKEEAKKNE